MVLVVLLGGGAGAMLVPMLNLIRSERVQTKSSLPRMACCDELTYRCCLCTAEVGKIAVITEHGRFLPFYVGQAIGVTTHTR